ncbi:MAG: hypothetical protein [Bacteriophage sp.]|nr:MAG: hypothetical protein [Bacteriophage sp.]
MQPITQAEAARRAGVSTPTMVYWMSKHDIVQYVDGKRMVNPEKLNFVIAARSALKLRKPVGA